MHKYMEKKNEINFDKIFNQVLGKSHVIYSTILNSKLVYRLIWSSSSFEIIRILQNQSNVINKKCYICLLPRKTLLEITPYIY